MPRTFAKRLSLKAISLSAVAFAIVAVTAGAAWAAVTDNMYPTANANLPCRSESGPDGNLSCDERLGCMETPVDEAEGLQDNNIDHINATY